MSARPEIKVVSFVVLISVFTAITAAPPAPAQVATQTTKLVAPDKADTDGFGYSVSVSGDAAVVGAIQDDDNGENSGSAYVFRRDQGGLDNWGFSAKLTADDGSDFDAFGWTVAISGDTVVVGARGNDSNGENSGSAYVFQRDHGGPDNWGQVVKITPDDGAPKDNFGSSASLGGDTLLIGARLDDDNGTNSGAVYVFERHFGGTDNWGQVTKLTPNDGTGDQRFGGDVELRGDVAIISATGDPVHGDDSGSAYIFYRNQGGPDNWGQVAKLVPSDGAAYDYFGVSVAIDGDTAIVGAYGDDDDGEGSGSAYVFKRDYGGNNNWGQVTKLTASDAMEDDDYGIRVSLLGDLAAIGAHTYRSGVPGSGTVYLLQRDLGGPDNWGEAFKIKPSDDTNIFDWGQSLAMDGDTIITSDSNDGVPGTLIRYGAAYIFTIYPCLVDTDCDDGIDCTDNFCDTVSGCYYVENDANCDDGSACTEDFCDPLDSAADAGGCLHETLTCTYWNDCPPGSTTCLNGLCHCDPIVEVPTLSQWGLFIMTLLGLCGGTLVFARRHRHETKS